MDRRDVFPVDDDPLALTLGSIYAAAPSPPTSRRRLNNGSVDVDQRRHSSSDEEEAVVEGVVMGGRRSSSGSGSDEAPPAGGRRRRRRSGSDEAPPPAGGDRPLAPAPFPWATEQPARHETLRSLLLRGITSVDGEMHCNGCGIHATVAYDLETKFREVRDFVAANAHAMHDRAPEAWLHPPLSDCATCGGKSSMLPVIAAEYSEINWLFLLLGQMLGCCRLHHLKYFCKNTGRHRTGAKNRVLYSTYMEMCKQLEP